MKYIWSLSIHNVTYIFDSLKLVKESVRLTYSAWSVKPTIVIERDCFIQFRAADSTTIEAFRYEVYTQPEHL